jgi:hypothetical protein
MSENLNETAEFDAELDDQEIDVAEKVDGEEPEPESEEHDQDDLVVSIGGESPPQNDEEQRAAPEWVKELRKNSRELARKNKELEQQLAAVSGTQQKPVEQLGAKPKLDDFEYDANAYEQALDDWYDRKRNIEQQQAKANAEQENAHKAWQGKVESYNTAKTKLKVSDFEDAEFVAQDALTAVQQAIVLQGAENPALVVYALGKNPLKAKELSSINNPVEFAFAVAKLEKELKVSNRKTAPTPERTVKGTGSISGSVDSQLERLRAQAEKTGDYTQVNRYKKQKRQA